MTLRLFFRNSSSLKPPVKADSGQELKSRHPQETNYSQDYQNHCTLLGYSHRCTAAGNFSAFHFLPLSWTGCPVPPSSSYELPSVQPHRHSAIDKQTKLVNILPTKATHRWAWRSRTKSKQTKNHPSTPAN